MSNPVDWYTPQWLLDLALETLQVEQVSLDPASSGQDLVPAAARYTVQEDGLQTSWAQSDGSPRETVYCNPPYRQPDLGRWVERFFAEYARGHYRRGLLLVPATPATQWFVRVWEHATAVIFLYKRVQFRAGAGQHVSSNPHGSVLVYVGAYDDADFWPWLNVGHIVRLKDS